MDGKVIPALLSAALLRAFNGRADGAAKTLSAGYKRTDELAQSQRKRLIMIEVYPDIVELVGSTVQKFQSHQVDAVRLDFPNEYPVRFEPYLANYAACDTMEAAGIDVLHNSEMENLLAGAVRDLVKNFEQIKRQRKSLANRLNNPVH